MFLCLYMCGNLTISLQQKQQQQSYGRLGALQVEVHSVIYIHTHIYIYIPVARAIPDHPFRPSGQADLVFQGDLFHLTHPCHPDPPGG